MEGVDLRERQMTRDGMEETEGKSQRGRCRGEEKESKIQRGDKGNQR